MSTSLEPLQFRKREGGRWRQQNLPGGAFFLLRHCFNFLNMPRGLTKLGSAARRPHDASPAHRPAAAVAAATRVRRTKCCSTLACGIEPKFDERCLAATSHSLFDRLNSSTSRLHSIDSSWVAICQLSQADFLKRFDLLPQMPLHLDTSCPDEGRVAYARQLALA